MITEEHIKEIKALSNEQKLDLMSMLWKDVYEEQNDMPVSDNHKRILNERMAKYESGKASFKSWEEIKAKYDF